jgi:hypothetical protein
VLNYFYNIGPSSHIIKLGHSIQSGDSDRDGNIRLENADKHSSLFHNSANYTKYSYIRLVLDMYLNGGTGLNLLMEFQDVRFFAVGVVVTCLLQQFFAV